METESWEGVDRALFDRLRELRLTLAGGRGVPPYVIFHDTTLREMARLRPSSAAALRDIYGVGQRKAEDVGPAFLEVIRATNSVYIRLFTPFLRCAIVSCRICGVASTWRCERAYR